MLKKDCTNILVGDSLLRLTVYRNGASNPLFIRLHGDEKEAQQVGCWWVEHFGGLFVDVDHETRTAEFNYHDTVISFDPNRIFSKEGIKATLEDYQSSSSLEIIKEIEKYSRAILAYCDSVNCVIALHNNKDFNINYYVKGGENYDPAVRVHINPHENPNNLILVTSERDFNYLKKYNLNLISECVDSQDHTGSLSEYCKRKTIRYFNIETQHGELAKQKALLKLVVDAF